jgi:hypothetical protein
MNKLLVTSLLLLLSAGAVAQDTRMRSVEDGHEVNASALRLPSSTGGTLTIKNCTECPTFSLGLTAQSQLIIGGTDVTLEELRRFLDANPSAPVLVVTPIGKNEVSRIKVAGNFKR